MSDFNTVRVGQLPEEIFNLTDNIPHEVGTDLKRGTLQNLATFIASVIEVSSGSGYLPISVTDGQQLPNVPTDSSFFLCGKGTFLNINGYPNIVCTEELNVIMSLSDRWQLAVEIPVKTDPLDAMISQTVLDGVLNYSPSENAVFDFAEQKMQKISSITGYSEILYPNEKAVNDALDLKANLEDLFFTTNTPPSTIQVGGINIGTVLAEKTAIEILEQMLVVYQNPTFSNFSMIQTSLIEVGEVLSGTKIFNWGTTNNGNIIANTLVITDVTSNTVLGSSLANDGTESLNIGTIVNTSPITRNWNIKGTNTKNLDFTSNNFTVNSIYSFFFGISNTVPTANQALINSGIKSVAQSTGTLNVTFGANNQYLWFAHPASNTTKTKWFVNALNNGNIGTISDLFNAPINVSITTVLWVGVLYKVYISNFPTTTTGNMELKNS